MARSKPCRCNCEVQKLKHLRKRRKQIYTKKSPQQIKAQVERERCHLTSSLLNNMSGYRSSDNNPRYMQKVRKIRWIWAYIKFLALFEDISFREDMDGQHLLNLLLYGPDSSTKNLPTLIKRSPLKILRYIKKITAQLKRAGKKTGKKFETEKHTDDNVLQAICQCLHDLRQAQRALQVARETNFTNCVINTRPAVEENDKDASVVSMEQRFSEDINAASDFTEEDQVLIDLDDYDAIPNKDDYQIIDVRIYSPFFFQYAKASLSDEETVEQNETAEMEGKECHQEFVKTFKSPHLIYLTHDGQHPPFSRNKENVKVRSYKKYLAPGGATTDEVLKPKRKRDPIIPLPPNEMTDLSSQVIYEPLMDISCDINESSVKLTTSKINGLLVGGNNFDIAINPKMPMQPTSFENMSPSILSPSSFPERNCSSLSPDVIDNLSSFQNDTQMSDNTHECSTIRHFNSSNLDEFKDSTVDDDFQSVMLNNLNTKILKHAIPLQRCEKCRLKNPVETSCVEASCSQSVLDFTSIPECPAYDFSADHEIDSTALFTDTFPYFSMEDISSVSSCSSLSLSPCKTYSVPVPDESGETIKQKRKRTVLMPLQTNEPVNPPPKMFNDPLLTSDSSNINRQSANCAALKMNGLFSERSKFDIAVNSKVPAQSTNFENVSPLRLPLSDVLGKKCDQSVLDFISSLDCPAYEFSTEYGIDSAAQSADMRSVFTMENITTLSNLCSMHNDYNSLSSVKLKGSDLCCDSGHKPSGSEWKCLSRGNEIKLLSASGISNSLSFKGNVVRI